MKEKHFHTVELSTIKQFTVEEIMTGKGIAAENLDYSSSVPTGPIGIPHQNRDNNLQVIQTKWGATNYETFVISNSELERYRGRLGC